MPAIKLLNKYSLGKISSYFGMLLSWLVVNRMVYTKFILHGFYRKNKAVKLLKKISQKDFLSGKAVACSIAKKIQKSKKYFHNFLYYNFVN